MENFQIKCVSCKSVTEFEFNDDYSEIKCLTCGHVFTEGKEELMRQNAEMHKEEINKHFADETRKAARDILG